MADKNLPVLSSEDGLSMYLQEIKKFPVLAPDEEYKLAKEWIDEGNNEAAHKLVTSHLRLVAKISMGYRGYGLPISEVISEGNIGLMQAVKRFDPDKGFRLATYAMWWIKAAIHEFVLRSWSLVKIGTTAAQKKLFFNLRRMKNRIQRVDENELSPEQIREISNSLGVSEDEVTSMNQRMAGDSSLNSPLKDDGEGGEWQDWLVDSNDSQEVSLVRKEELENRRECLTDALKKLNDRERRIFIARRLKEQPLTLEELSQEFGVSRERIRQIEVKAFEKVQKEIINVANSEEL